MSKKSERDELKAAMLVFDERGGDIKQLKDHVVIRRTFKTSFHFNDPAALMNSLAERQKKVRGPNERGLAKAEYWGFAKYNMNKKKREEKLTTL